MWEPHLKLNPRLGENLKGRINGLDIFLSTICCVTPDLEKVRKLWTNLRNRFCGVGLDTKASKDINEVVVSVS